MGCSNDKSVKVEEENNNKKNEVKNENKYQNENKNEDKALKEKEDQELREKQEREKKEKEEREKKEKEEREKKEKEERELKEKEEREKKEKEERELKEKEEREKKEKEEREKNPMAKLFEEDEKTGSENESHNSEMPADPGHYLSVPINTKKNNVFIPTKEDLSRFQRDGLKRHNYYRKYHQVGPLELTEKLNDYAQKYAETLANKNVMQHSSKSDREKIYGDWTGENLYSFWTSASDLTINGAAAVDSWYDEIKDYDFSSGKSKNGGVVGHFTQLAWKGTTQLGIGVAKSKQNSVFVVANYHFGGNFNSAELTNVFPVKLDQKDLEEKERKEKEKKEKEAKEKEKEEKQREATNQLLKEDDKTGESVKSHNSTIPDDTGKYLDIHLNESKDNVCIPTKEDLSRFQRDGLKRHNYYRKYHQVGPLELTEKLNDYAQKYAETLAEKNTMQHSSTSDREKIYGDWTGENLYYFWTSVSDLTINGAAAVDSWYDEIKDYDFSSGKSKNGGVVGHFTQLVWKGTTQLGIGVAKSKQNSVFIVGNYHFGGNFNNEYKSNVFPAKAK